MSTQKNKIPAVYLNDETHKVMKKWSEYSGLTMPKLAQSLLEEMQPVLAEMVKAYEDIEAGKNKEQALMNIIAKGLSNAGEQLYEENEVEANATDNGKGD